MRVARGVSRDEALAEMEFQRGEGYSRKPTRQETVEDVRHAIVTRNPDPAGLPAFWMHCEPDGSRSVCGVLHARLLDSGPGVSFGKFRPEPLPMCWAGEVFALVPVTPAAEAREIEWRRDVHARAGGAK